MKKRKWNWLDTVIVIVVIVAVCAVALFFLRPTGEEFAHHEEKEYLISFCTEKARMGTYDLIKEGDEISLVKGKQLGVIEKVEFKPSETAVFDENTKQFVVDKNEDYPVCYITVKTNGYENADGQVYVMGESVIYDEDWNLETTSYRFSGKVVDAKEAE